MAANASSPPNAAGSIPFSTSTVYLKTFAVPWPACGVTPGTTCHDLAPASVNGPPLGSIPVGRLASYWVRPLGWSVDDHGAHGADLRRPLQRMTGRGRRRARPGDSLIEHHTGDGDQHRQRVGAPAVGRDEASQPTLLAPATGVTIRPDAPGRHPTRADPAGHAAARASRREEPVSGCPRATRGRRSLSQNGTTPASWDSRRARRAHVRRWLADIAAIADE